jgi:PIN domain nuclease of toxin-antitoxin system
MKYLLDTHVLLWAAANPEKISPSVRTQLEDSQNELYFSAASIWEIAIKQDLNREDFKIDVMQFRQALLENEYEELPIGSDHAVFTRALANHHKDPFDRILIAQAWVEDITLITADERVAQYIGPIQKI